jgi:hypothetical protein
MSRGINATTKAALQTDGFKLATLIQIDFPARGVNPAFSKKITDFGVNITATMGTFTSSGHILGIGSASETSELRVNSLNLTLSGSDREYITLFQEENYMNSRCVIWRAVINDSNSIVGDPFLFFDGRISGYSIEDDSSSSRVEVEIASHWKDFEKVINRKTNTNSQKVHFPDDLGFEFASATVKDLKWGRK